MPKYDERVFRRRFRMYPALFRRILTGVVGADPSFQRRRDAVGHWSISPEVKITAALRMLASGCTADSLDEYFQLGESTALEILRKFCNAIVQTYGDEYLREPTHHDLEKLLTKATQRGFPGMIGSIDCMHWEWRNCPTAWAGQYSGHVHRPTVVLEAVAGYNTWIWHAYFGTAGSLNDINILGQSPVFDRILNGSTPSLRFKVNDSWYDTCYYLADGIYPAWSTLVKTIANPTDNKEVLFAERQEGYRKDVERAFGILQARWAIVRNPARSWDVPTLKNIMLTCIILHNMIIEDEQVNEFDEMRGDLDYEFTFEQSLILIPCLKNGRLRHQCIRLPLKITRLILPYFTLVSAPLFVSSFRSSQWRRSKSFNIRICFIKAEK
ncbi:Protein ANTAGONIST OF LIKE HETEROCHROMATIN PROTEIN 1 [Linum grandiflorum]